VVAVVGYLIAVSVAIAATVIAAGPRQVTRRDESLEIGDIAARQVSVIGGLAGFAVTGIVLLVTLSRNLPDASTTSFTTILAMFVVAYMGNFAASTQLTHVSTRLHPAGFDLGAAQFAGATISQYYVFVGWLALRPLFETFGLTLMAELVVYFLIAAVTVGYAPLASVVHRCGFATIRMIVLMPVLATAVTAAYVVVARVGGVERVPETTLALTLLAFVPGALAHGALAILPILARSARLSASLAERAHLFILGYAMAVMVLVYFLLLSVFGVI
jgi:hypothetical protein